MDNPLLKSALAQQKVIIQKVAGEMRTALNDASRLQPTSKARAINALKAAMSKLEDPLIPQSFRQEWTANLNGAIARIEKGQSADLPAPAVNPVNREMKAAERGASRPSLKRENTFTNRSARSRRWPRAAGPISRKKKPTSSSRNFQTIQRCWPWQSPHPSINDLPMPRF